MKEQDKILLTILFLLTWALYQVLHFCYNVEKLTANEITELQSFVETKDWQGCDVQLIKGTPIDKLRVLSMASIDANLEDLRKMDVSAIKDKWNQCLKMKINNKMTDINEQINTLNSQ